MQSAALAPVPQAAAGQQTQSLYARVLENALLICPVALLGLAATVCPGPARTWFALGWAIEVIALLWWTIGSPLGYRSSIMPVGVFSLLAAIWFWSAPDAGGIAPIAMAVLLLGPMALLMLEFGRDAGLSELREAHRVIRRLARRREWPESLSRIRQLPEVKELRQAISRDAQAVWALLAEPTVPARVAGLAALEFRQHWMPRQAEAVLRWAHPRQEPAVRASALRALGMIEDPRLLGLIASCLRDGERDVRKAAMEALLARPKERWAVYRASIHAVMGDPRYRHDGSINKALPGPLPEHAVDDLTGWASESGPIALRATASLKAHYRKLLYAEDTARVVKELGKIIRDDRTPAVLRVELAHLLRDEGYLEPRLLDKLLGPSYPSGLRLLAADTLLTQNAAHRGAIDVLREVARQPNRELALTVAKIVQRCLRVDLGLPWDGDAPEPRSRAAAEVTRRVMEWADRPNLATKVDPADDPSQVDVAAPVSASSPRPVGGWDW